MNASRPCLACKCSPQRHGPSLGRCVVDQTHAKVRVLTLRKDKGRAAFGTGASHLLPFLLPTSMCDCEHRSIQEHAQRLVPAHCSAARAAAVVRAWVRSHIRYELREPSDSAQDSASDSAQDSASTILARRAGTCTNRTTLQIALLRAAGIPAGYVLVHVTEAAFKDPPLLPQDHERASPIAVHVFCAAYITFEDRFEEDTGVDIGWCDSGSFRNYDATKPLGAHYDATEPLGAFRHYDATEPLGASHLTEHVSHSDETRVQRRWQRGPFAPVQANLDHLIIPCTQMWQKRAPST